MSFLTAKIPQALADRIGASAADFSEKLTALLDGQDAKLAAALAAPKPAEPDAGLVARLEAVESKLAELSAAPAVDRAALLKECRDAAATETAAKLSAVLAKTGGSPLAASEPAQTGDTLANATPEQRWKSDPKLQADFSCAESYAAYCKAEAKGIVRIQSRNK